MWVSLTWQIRTNKRRTGFVQNMSNKSDITLCLPPFIWSATTATDTHTSHLLSQETRGIRAVSNKGVSTAFFEPKEARVDLYMWVPPNTSLNSRAFACRIFGKHGLWGARKRLEKRRHSFSLYKDTENQKKKRERPRKKEPKKSLSFFIYVCVHTTWRNWPKEKTSLV